MLKIKAIILDFDGTIADTRQSIIATVKQTLDMLCLPAPDDSEIQKVIGLPLRDTFVRAAKIVDETLIAQAISLYRVLYNNISLNTVKLFPHVPETLKALHDDGFILSIASSKGKNSLTRLLELLNISHYITSILGEQDVQNRKPAPDMVLKILHQVHINAEETMVIGDTQYDILMGQNAGCFTCGVSYGNHTREMLQQQGADYIIDDFAQLTHIVSKQKLHFSLCNYNYFPIIT